MSDRTELESGAAPNAFALACASEIRQSHDRDVLDHQPLCRLHDAHNIVDGFVRPKAGGREPLSFQ